VTESTAANVTWLTQDAYDRLEAELEHRTGELRVEISRRIEAARAEGDLRENGGYHAAKEEQGKNEARIRQLTALLRDAHVGDAPHAEEGVAGPGMVVTVRFDGDDEDERFLIGSREEAVHADIDVYSAQSPIGLALTGKTPGEKATYTTPTGQQMTVELLHVEPYTG
jgi:transcription elongation factor GreA